MYTVLRCYKPREIERSGSLNFARFVAAEFIPINLQMHTGPSES